ncbi:SAFB-like transcription modulator [Monodelphis domestica]|uniref:SAFB-like transcription modulator n=1 Tax=Monodelphis domestica TaxID=13616 RepID=UPI0024E2504E|nr:SAFB-like transcription modulator [Monodelphis domestica]
MTSTASDSSTAMVAASEQSKSKISDLRVSDLRLELKRRNLLCRGVKTALIARLKQAIEEEGGDPDYVDLSSSCDTLKKKAGAESKSEIEETDDLSEDASEKDNLLFKESQSENSETSDLNGHDKLKDSEEVGENDEYNNSKDFSTAGHKKGHELKQVEAIQGKVKDLKNQENEGQDREDDTILTIPDIEEEKEKDTIGSGDGTQEVPNHLPSEEKLDEADQWVHEEREGNVPVKESEDDILLTIQAEDIIFMDFDGDDLETDKNVKITESEASKLEDGQDAFAKSLEKESKDYELNKSHKDGKKEEQVKGDTAKKETRKNPKKAESEDKEKDTFKKGPLSTEASCQTKNSSKKSKESKTLSSSIAHLPLTEIPGQQISVEKIKGDPSKKELKKESDEKSSSGRNTRDRRFTTNDKTNKTQVSTKKEDKKSDKKESKDCRRAEDKDEKDVNRPKSPTSVLIKKREEIKQISVKSPSHVVIFDQTKGDHSRFARREKCDKLARNKERARQDGKDKDYKSQKDISSLEKLKDQRMPEQLVSLERTQAMELRRQREIVEMHREWERIRMFREEEELQLFQRERERLKIERQKLERERMERKRLEEERIQIRYERLKEAERFAREREELRRQQQQLRYEQEKRNSLKRPRDVDHWRDDSYWNKSKKLSHDTDARFRHGSDYNRQQNRFYYFDHRERTQFPEDTASLDASTFERQEHFVSQGERKKKYPIEQREEDPGFEKYPPNFSDSRRNEPPPSRNELRDTERQEMWGDRIERPVHDRSGASRRYPREGGANPLRQTSWNHEGGMNTEKWNTKIERPERSGREVSGHVIGGNGNSSSGYGSRDGDRGKRKWWTAGF